MSTEFTMPETQYAQSGDLSIAYQVLGDGPIDVVFVSGFISHQELQWEGAMRLPIRRVAEYARLITFDKRGTGLSERTLGYGGAEDRMDDIRAVMDAAGSERAAVIGLSEGGPLAILFAATYPERTTGLVLWNTYARAGRPRLPDRARPQGLEGIHRAHRLGVGNRRRARAVPRDGGRRRGTEAGHGPV